MDKMRPKHGEKECPEDAWKKWEWIRFPGDESHTETPELKVIRENKEKKAERETDRDLKKPIPQLVADFNVVVENLVKNRHLYRKREEDVIYLLAAQKRMVAMMAQVAIEHRKISRWMLILTIAILLLTCAIAGRDYFKKPINNSKVIESTINKN